MENNLIKLTHNNETKKRTHDTQTVSAITFEKMIAKQKQSIFLFDRKTNLQFRKMQNEIYGSLITIQYHANAMLISGTMNCMYI